MGDDDDTRTVHRDAGSGEFVGKEEADANPDTTVSQTVPVSRHSESIQSQRERAEKAAKTAEEERLKLEQLIDAETAERTATYDQSIKERAAAVGVNPDNFNTEAELEAAVVPLEPAKENTNEEI